MKHRSARLLVLSSLALVLLPGCIVIQPVEPAPPEAAAATLGAMIGEALAAPEPPPPAPLPPPPRWTDPGFR